MLRLLDPLTNNEKSRRRPQQCAMLAVFRTGRCLARMFHLAGPRMQLMIKHTQVDHILPATMRSLAEATLLMCCSSRESSRESWEARLTVD